MKWFGPLIVALSTCVLCAAGGPLLTLPVGGLKPATIAKVSGERKFREPDGPRGQYKHGFRVLNDSAADWQKFYGVQFEVKLSDAREVELIATILRSRRNPQTLELPVRGSVLVSGKGWHTITLPWSAFDFEQANTAFLKYVKEFHIAAKLGDGSPAKFQLRNVRVIKAPVVSLETEVHGKPAPQNGSVEYDVTRPSKSV